ncbi:polysaccharide deacetylase family protein [Phormidium sp. CLA17]|uniref:polysaccharide deacetylase family protein n=1 Tax=Leptolyngbya sp. Cla-17 TaxID=2803751 RepID=UPI001491C2CB|nr:polysaccharide deacetylase family protein [Leptolyngbya sp. Cla-17]MBM0740859.1 polysaccharide deacetylase family protein [Leptolyngbya sp. Cla-17]
MNKVVLLSFDVEEFDIPEEYGQTLDEREKFRVSLKGLEPILHLLERLNIRATFFTTANFALHHQPLIRAIAQTHEIASHGFYHSSFEPADLAASKQALEQIIQVPITGFRMARLQKVNDCAIERAGYAYNSSMNPTYLPGRYNNFFTQRTAYYSQQLLNIPVSVTPLIRFPLFWLSFKNLPLPLYKLASLFTLRVDRYLSLYFHPWEFTDLSAYGLPSYVKRHSGQSMLLRLERYLIWLHSQADFVTYADFRQFVHPKFSCLG